MTELFLSTAKSILKNLSRGIPQSYLNDSVVLCQPPKGLFLDYILQNIYHLAEILLSKFHFNSTLIETKRGSKYSEVTHPLNGRLGGPKESDYQAAIRVRESIVEAGVRRSRGLDTKGVR